MAPLVLRSRLRCRASQHSLGLLSAAALTASALLLLEPPPPLLLCCRREPSRKCRFHPLQSERVRSRRTALHPLPPRRTPPSLFFLIWTPEEIYIYKSVVAATSSSSATASRTFRRRLGASLSLCPGFLQRHAARGIIVVIACEPSFTHTHLTASAPPPSRAHTAPIFLHFHKTIWCVRVLLLC